MSKPILHGFPQSTYVWTARATMAIKGVEFELDALAPPKHRSDEHLARHPFGKVPALTHGELGLFETDAICEYVDGAFEGPALQPDDPVERARMRQWISVANSYLYPVAVLEYLFGYIFPKTEDGSPDRARIDAAIPKLEQILGLLDGELAGKSYVVGDQLSLADLYLAPLLFVVSHGGEGKDILAKYPHIDQYMGRMSANEAFMAQAPSGPPTRAPVGARVAEAARFSRPGESSQDDSMADGPRVVRYTIDNRYDDTLISVAKAELRPGIQRFANDPDDWGEEEPLMITPRDFRDRLRTLDPATDWASLRPGQVYLQGAFDIEGDPEAPTGFTVDAECDRWLRIDHLPLIKDALARQYARLLQASGKGS